MSNVCKYMKCFILRHTREKFLTNEELADTVLLTPISLNLPKNKHVKSLCTLVKWCASGEKSGKVKVINASYGNS